MNKINIRGVFYAYKWLKPPVKEFETLVCFHGFTGSSQTFECLGLLAQSINILCVDLIGHGQTDSYVHPYRYKVESQCLDLKILCEKLELTSIYVLGYSMGGRLSLAFGIAYPDFVKGLILESTSPGLKTNKEQTKRKHQDGKKAAQLLNQGIESFVSDWENLPIFDSQKGLPQAVQIRIRQERLSQNAYGLAAHLHGFGTGTQPSLWGRISDGFIKPVHLIVGEKDIKFVSFFY